MQNQKKVQMCAEALKSMLPQGNAPQIGLVLGTGLGHLAVTLEDAVRIPYSALPGFPASTTQSHQGAFVAGRLPCGVSLLVQQGRCHLYEGRSPEEVCMGVRVMSLCGIKALLITNAAGALNPRFDVGGLMLITDHINFTGASPLSGPNVGQWGPRFPDMSRAYDADLGRILESAALGLGLRLEKGVYAGVAGPQLETPAETRFLRLAGADAVGMSLVMEVIAARHMGLRVAGISTLSNKNLPDCMVEHSIEQIIAQAEAASYALGRLLHAALPEIDAAEAAR